MEAIARGPVQPVDTTGTVVMVARRPGMGSAVPR
jgi:hypothetical protein